MLVIFKITICKGLCICRKDLLLYVPDKVLSRSKTLKDARKKSVGMLI